MKEEDETTTTSKGSRYRSGDGCQFSSQKVPSGVGMETCCELPFGFVWTPMAPCSQGSMSVVDCKGEALPPVLCLSCLSYINMYAKLDSVNNTWECPLCGSDENVLDPTLLVSPDGILSSALATPMVEFRQQFHRLFDTSNTNTNKITSHTYILVLDANLNREEANAVGRAIQEICCNNHTQQNEEIHIGLIVFDKTIAMYQLGLSSMTCADVCTIHQANSNEHLINRKSQIQNRPYLATLQQQARSGAAGGGGGAGHGDDLSCLWRCLSAVYGTRLGGDPSHDVDSTTTSSLPGEHPQPPPMSRLEKLKQRKESRLRRDQAHKNPKDPDHDVSLLPQESPWVRAQHRKAHRHPYRCTGEALQCAIDLATISQANANYNNTSHVQILLFTNGCPNLGDGSVVVVSESGTVDTNKKSKRYPLVQRVKPDVIDPERLAGAVTYFEKLASIAQEHEVGIDVFCTGAS